MRKFMVNIFATTGISILLLSMTALLFQAKYICVETVFQVLGTNIMVHIGLIFLGKLEMKDTILEIALDLALITGMLMAFGSIFHWYASTPIWILVVMGFVLYIVSSLLHLLCMKREAQEINALIKRRNSKTSQ